MDYHFQFHLNNITPPNSFLIYPKPLKRNNMELEVEAQEQQTSAGFLSPKVLISLGTSTPPMFSNMPRSSEVPTTFFPSLYNQSPHQENSHTTTTTTASCHSNNNNTQLLGKRQEMEGGDDQYYHEMGSCRESEDHDMKAKIVGHPQYSNLLDAYMDCQKVGAPKQVVDKLSAIRKDLEHKQERSSNFGSDSSINDPELDQFMGAFYDVLVRYRDELSRPLQEAMQFLRSIESQLNTLCEGSGSTFSLDDKLEDAASTEGDDNGGSVGEAQTDIDQVDLGGADDDINLKRWLLKKYGGYLGSLRQELSKKKKKGKLPKDARQKLLSWWELHYIWPYPSEAEKVALAESTGLDQKQINNWFINQRKRHWKPSDDMQFVVPDHGNYHHQPHMHPHVAPHEAATAHTSSFYIDHHHRHFINGNTSFSFNP